MNTTVGYVLVGQPHESYQHPCQNPDCTKGPDGVCDYPKRPACHARCLRDPALHNHAECEQWQREYDAWVEAHFSERPTGRTVLGPLHYFADCLMIVKGANRRRKDSRMVELDLAMIQLLNLPVCWRCQARMAPLENQFTETQACTGISL